MKTVERIIQIEERDGHEWSMLSRLFDLLHWTHYPTNVTGEEIDEGNDSDEAKAETVEVPADQVDIFDWLDENCTFDYC